MIRRVRKLGSTGDADSTFSTHQPIFPGMNRPYVLETERLTLRNASLDDAEFMLRLLNEPSFHRFIGDRGVRTAR